MLRLPVILLAPAMIACEAERPIAPLVLPPYEAGPGGTIVVPGPKDQPDLMQQLRDEQRQREVDRMRNEMERQHGRGALDAGGLRDLNELRGESDALRRRLGQ